MKRLVRSIDVSLNGEHGAAKQASLCDIAAQLEKAARLRGAPVLEPAPAADGWRPLSGAPVGEPVLLAYKLGLGWAVGHKDEGGVWRGHEGSNWGDGTTRFVGWTPLPPPPKERG